MRTSAVISSLPLITGVVFNIGGSFVADRLIVKGVNVKTVRRIFALLGG